GRAADHRAVTLGIALEDLDGVRQIPLLREGCRKHFLAEGIVRSVVAVTGESARFLELSNSCRRVSTRERHLSAKPAELFVRIAQLSPVRPFLVGAGVQEETCSNLKAERRLHGSVHEPSRLLPPGKLEVLPERDPVSLDEVHLREHLALHDRITDSS